MTFKRNLGRLFFLSLIIFVLSASDCRGVRPDLRDTPDPPLNEVKFSSEIVPINLQTSSLCSDSVYCSALDDYARFNQVYSTLSKYGIPDLVRLTVIGNGESLCSAVSSSTPQNPDCVTSINSCATPPCAESDVIVVSGAVQNDFVVDQENALFVASALNVPSTEILEGSNLLLVGTQSTCDTSSFVCVVVPDSWQASSTDQSLFAVGSLVAKVFSLWKQSITNKGTLLDIISRCRDRDLFVIDVACFFNEDQTLLSLRNTFEKTLQPAYYKSIPLTYSIDRRSWTENRYCVTLISWCGPATPKPIVEDLDTRRSEVIKGYSEMISSYENHKETRDLRIAIFTQEPLSGEDENVIREQTLNAFGGELATYMMQVDFIACPDGSCDELSPPDPSSSVLRYEIVILENSEWRSRIGQSPDSLARVRSALIIMPYWFDEGKLAPPDLTEEEKTSVIQVAIECNDDERDIYCFSRAPTKYQRNFDDAVETSEETVPEETVNVVFSSILGITIAQWSAFYPRLNFVETLKLFAQDCDWTFECFFSDGVFQPLSTPGESVPLITVESESSSPVFSLKNTCIHLLFSLCREKAQEEERDLYTDLTQLFTKRTQSADRDSYKAFIHYLNADDLGTLEKVLPNSLSFCSNRPDCDNNDYYAITSSVCVGSCSAESSYTNIIYASKPADVQSLVMVTDDDDQNTINGIFSPIVVINIANADQRNAYQTLSIKDYTGTVFVASTKNLCGTLERCFVVSAQENVYQKTIDEASYFLSVVVYLSSLSTAVGYGEGFVTSLLSGACYDSTEKTLDLGNSDCLGASGDFQTLVGERSYPKGYDLGISGDDADLFLLNPESVLSCFSRSSLCDGLLINNETLEIPGFSLLERYIQQQKEKIRNGEIPYSPIHIGVFADANSLQSMMEVWSDDACLKRKCPSLEEFSETNTPIFEVEHCLVSCENLVPTLVVLAPSSPSSLDLTGLHFERSLFLSSSSVEGIADDKLLIAIGNEEECPTAGRCLTVPSTYVVYNEEYTTLQINQSLEEITRLAILTKVSGYVMWLWPFMERSYLSTLLLTCGQTPTAPSLSLECLDGGDSISHTALNALFTQDERSQWRDDQTLPANACLISLCSRTPSWVGEVRPVNTFLPSTVTGYRNFLSLYQSAYEEGLLEQKTLTIVANVEAMSETTKEWFSNLPMMLKKMFHNQQADEWVCTDTCSPNTPIKITSYGCETSEACYTLPTSGVLVAYDASIVPQNLDRDTLIIFGGIGHGETQPETYSTYSNDTLDNILWVGDIAPHLSPEAETFTAVDCPASRTTDCVFLPASFRHYKEDDQSNNQDIYATSAAILGVLATQIRTLFPVLTAKNLKSTLLLCERGNNLFALSCFVNADARTLSVPFFCEETADTCTSHSAQYEASLRDVPGPFYQNAQATRSCYGYNSLCSGIVSAGGSPSTGIEGYDFFIYNIKNDPDVLINRESVSVATLLPSEAKEKTFLQRQNEGRTSMIIIASVAGDIRCANTISRANVEGLSSSLCSTSFIQPLLVECLTCEVMREVRVVHIPDDFSEKQIRQSANRFPEALLVINARASDNAISLPEGIIERTLQAGTWTQEDGERVITQNCFVVYCLIVPDEFYGFDQRYQNLLVHKQYASTEILAGIASLIITLFPSESANSILRYMSICSQSDNQDGILALSCVQDTSVASDTQEQSPSSAEAPLPALASGGVLRKLGNAPGSLLWRSTMAFQEGKSNPQDTVLLRPHPWLSFFVGSSYVREENIDVTEGIAMYSGGDLRISLASFFLEGRVLSVLSVRNFPLPISLGGQQAVVTLDMGISVAIKKRLAFVPVEMSLQGSCLSGSIGLTPSRYSLEARPSCKASMGLEVSF